MSPTATINNNNINPKILQLWLWIITNLLYWNPEKIGYWQEVITQKKHICPDIVTNKKRNQDYLFVGWMNIPDYIIS